MCLSARECGVHALMVVATLLWSLTTFSDVVLALTSKDLHPES